MQNLSVPSSAFPDVLQLDDSYVAATGKAIGSALYRRAPALYADSLAYALAAHLVSLAGQVSLPTPHYGLGNDALHDVVDYIQGNLGGNLTVDNLAA